MKQSSKRLLSGLVALAFIVVALIVFFDLIQPAYGDLQKEKGIEASTENLLANEQQMVNQAKKLIGQYENENQAEANLALAMPTGPNVAGALAQIYGIGQNNRIAIQGVTIGAPSLALKGTSLAPGSVQGSTQEVQIVKPMGTFSLQVAANGSYEDFKSFLSQIETNIRIFDLTTFTLQPAQGVGGGGRGAASDFFTGNVTVSTYYQSP